MKDGQLFTVLALLDKGTVNCCSDDLNQPAATASLFGPGDENAHVPSGPSPAELARLKAQQEAQQKEAERLKAEEEARRLEEERIKQEKEAEKERVGPSAASGGTNLPAGSTTCSTMTTTRDK